MILLNAVVAHEAAMKMCECELPYDTAHALVTLCAKLRPHVEYFLTEERKLADEYAVKGEDGQVKITEGNKLSFYNTEEKTMYDAERSKLAAVNFGFENGPIKAQRPDSIRGVWLQALDGFIEFI